ncbi:MAG TPA: GH3 auxin-responsive promoter family protein [Mobilitalea sp.]|nr:GH3 auxin-responsive promoter family protein [Mobilitalea sp.]
MKFEEKLKNKQHDMIWKEYCGFLDLDLDSYMNIQNRLMTEQITLWSESELGRKLLNGRRPRTIDEFRQMVPLTTYGDYADILLQKKGEMLPDAPIIWIQTTWEGGKHPIKVAPYTKSMLETYRNNIIACLILSTSPKKGKFNVRATDTFLYGLAPLPYATGLFPLALSEEIGIEFLPPVKDAVKMSFGERNKKGFKLGLKKGIDFFFGLGSVAYYVSLSLSSMSKGSSKPSSDKANSSGIFKLSPGMLVKLILAKHRCKKENRELKPKDIFKLKGFMCAGTDNHCYKDDLEDLWGVRPMELFAGTEPSIMGTETWTRNGMYFFPDTCFYEFIPEEEMYKNLEDSTYKPNTYLMNEVVPGEKYELVITVLKGGAFVRYRVGDMYQCAGLVNHEDETKIPRFKYIDRIPSIIDIAGFTRISENCIQDVIDLSGLPIENWIAVKEYNKHNRPMLHMYVEMKSDALVNAAISKEILREQLSIYFKYVDQDYKDLKHILGMDPLEITILKCGTFAGYEKLKDKKLNHINPSAYDVLDMLRYKNKDFKVIGGRAV